MKAVVTGAGGHIGFNVARILLQKGFVVLLLARRENDNLIKLKLLGASVHYVDLFRPETFINEFRDASVLFHLAAENTTATHDREGVLKNTFQLAQTVIGAAIQTGVKTIVYTSSVVVLGRSDSSLVLYDENNRNTKPESPYVEGKLLSENYCRKLCEETGADIRIVYPSWVIGEGDIKGTPPHQLILKFLEKGERFYFKGGISVADVAEVAEGHVNSWLMGQRQGRYVLGGQNITFLQFYSELAKICNRKNPALLIPKPVILIVSWFLKYLSGKKNIVDPGYVKAVVGKYSWYNSNKAVSEISYRIRTVEEILRKGTLEASAIRYKTNKIFNRKTGAVSKLYDDNDLLLITGFPGWLSNRMLDIMLNGDYFGKNKIDRRIRLLVQDGIQFHYTLPENVELYYGDLNDTASLLIALKGVKCVYHLAGLIYPKRINDLYRVNTKGTKNLVDACIVSGIRRFIFSSTDSVCGYSRTGELFSDHEPPKPYKNYGKSKLLAEQYILEKTRNGELDGTVLRGFWFFGPFAPPRNLNFYKMMNRKRQLVFGNGKNKRTITHIDNLVQAFIQCENVPSAYCKWYWIGDGSGTLIVDEICSNITKALGVKYWPLYVPGWCCNLAAAADTFLGLFGRLNASLHAAGKFHRTIAARSDAASRDFGYEPTAGFEQIKQELKKIN